MISDNDVNQYCSSYKGPDNAAGPTRFLPAMAKKSVRRKTQKAARPSRTDTPTLGNSGSVVLPADVGGTASPVPGGRSDREIARTTEGGQTGRSRSGRANIPQRPLRNAAEAPLNSREAYLGDPDPRKQGIANRSAKEENRRQAKVVLFRAENVVKNTRVQKPSRAPGKKKVG